jgi:hypothetical protein
MNRPFVLNRGWKPVSLQITISVYVCSTWEIVELKTRFETWIICNYVNCVSFVVLFLFYITYGLRVIATYTKYPNQVFYVWSFYIRFVLNRCCKPVSFQIMIMVYVGSTWIIVELKTRIETWLTWNDVNGVSLIHISYLITPMAYLCSQMTRNIQIKYFMFDWSIYILLC